MRSILLVSVLTLLSTTAMANQAYIQSTAWQVNKLPVLKGQAPHARCLLQTSFSGNASIQWIAEGQKLRGAIVILTEPVFQAEGRSIDVTLSAGGKAYEFPARTISQYSAAIEISDAYEAAFQANLRKASSVELKSGFDSYVFSIEPVGEQLTTALACTPPAALPVVADVTTPSPDMEQVIAKATEAAPEPESAARTPSSIQSTVIGGAKKEGVVQSAYFVPKSGTNVALSEALPMILPPGYKVNYTQGASAGARISWNAGGDWLETLVVALDDVDLQAAATGKTVTVLPKIKSTVLAVTSDTGESNRANIIVKEPGMTGDMPVIDPTKPPSPGMTLEADALLKSMTLNQKDLIAIAGGDSAKMMPIMDEGGKGKNKDIVEMPPMPDKSEPKIETVLAITPPEPDDVFVAKKGETVQEVLTRWSAQSGATTDITLKRAYFVGQEVRVQGDVELAVQELMAQFDDLPERPRIDGGEGAMTAQPTLIVPPEPSEMERRLGLIANWNAVEGTSLRAALSNWARQSQMQLVWESPDDVIVAGNVMGAQRLEDALDGLLAGYDDKPQKPSIQINRDPDTGRMAMIVDVQPFSEMPKDDSQ